MNDLTKERESLKPCPFCGGEARVSVAMDESIWNHNTVPWTTIQCGDCDANTGSICEGDSPTAHERWQARAALSTPAVPKGFVLVPVEPTLEMLTAAALEDDKAFVGGSAHGAARDDVWAAMLAAAPQQPQAVPEKWRVALERIADPLNTHFAGDAQVVAREALAAAPQQPGPAVQSKPIERDESMQRDYIPLPGGWEVQTKGNGSTMRLLDKKAGERHPLMEPQHVLDFIERMAREIHAAVSGPAVQGEAWIPVSERLPEPEEDVLVRCEFGSAFLFTVAGMFKGYSDGPLGWYAYQEPDKELTVTHWMPLPPPPVQAQEGGK